MNHKERAERRVKIAEFAAIHGTAKAALEFSVSHQLVTQCLKNRGMRGNDKLTVKVSSFEILRKLLEGQSGSEIAKEHNVSRQFVSIVKKKAQAAGFSFDCVDRTQMVDELVAGLKSLVKVIEENGDYDKQFGVGEALDRVWMMIDRIEPQNI